MAVAENSLHEEQAKVGPAQRQALAALSTSQSELLQAQQQLAQHIASHASGMEASLALAQVLSSVARSS